MVIFLCQILDSARSVPRSAPGRQWAAKNTNGHRPRSPAQMSTFGPRVYEFASHKEWLFSPSDPRPAATVRRRLTGRAQRGQRVPTAAVAFQVKHLHSRAVRARFFRCSEVCEP